MKKFTIIIISLCILVNFDLIAKVPEKTKEKKKFTFQDAMNFKYVQKSIISFYGNWVAYEVAPDWGDGYVGVVFTSDTTKNYKIERGASPAFSNDESWFACLIKPKLIDLENAKSNKDKPKNNLKILSLNTKKENVIEKVSKFQFSENSKWLVYEKDETIENDKKLKFKPLGSNIALVHLKSGTEINIDNVKQYKFDSLSNYFFYCISSPDGKKDGLYYRNLNEEFAPEYIISQKEKTLFSNLAYSDSTKTLAFTQSSLKDDGTPDQTSLYIWKPSENNTPYEILNNENLPKNWTIYYKNNIKFAKDGSFLWFGLKPISELYPPEKYERKFTDTSLANLDSLQANSNLLLWHYNDPKIITNQQVLWNNIKDRTYPAIYNFETKKFLQIADTIIKEVEQTEEHQNYTVGYDETPYEVQSTWNADIFDLYKINLKTGERKLIAKELQEQANLSPDGKYVVYYKDSLWYIHNNFTDTTKIATPNMQFPMYNEENDVPDKAQSYGFAGWYEESKRFFINDRYDVWVFSSEEPRNHFSLTGSYGRTNKVIYRLINTLNNRSYYKFKDTVLVSGFSTELKWKNLYYVEFKIIGPEKLTFFNDKNVNFRAMAKGNNSIIYTIEDFDQFPDLWFKKNPFNKNDSTWRLTDINPQMKDFYWGTTEKIEWKDSQGNNLQGFIMKPENFDPKKKYPVIIHFYEKFSDYMHTFQRPAINHRPNPVIYLNDDYVMFYPDIVFKVGYPGFSSEDALITGSKKLIEMGIADPNAIGLQGHSWSGYQTAFIITQTDFFKAASAGAPVSNMTSAYSGIRLGSGLARQFQYEKQQSRIGGNLWDSLDNYIKNSPVFAAPKVNTPLLIEFGDIDDAVPWQQGIELYLAFRRLNKPVFMLEYEKEPHILRKYYNKVDYAIKMKQFFDHYLKGKPAPEWLIKGIPYRGN
jgi:hypothetical protein